MLLLVLIKFKLNNNPYKKNKNKKDENIKYEKNIKKKRSF
jgi:hypothetical protein